MNILRTIIRPLIAAPFIADGLDAMRRPAPHAKKISPFKPTLRRLGLGVVADNPELASRALGAVTVGAAGMLALGKMPRTTAAVLTAISVPLAIVNTASEKDMRAKVSTGIQRGALTGAMVLASLDRAGAPSAAWLANSWVTDKMNRASAQLDQVKNNAEASLEAASQKLSNVTK
ncbi:hypothetical protein BK816_03535 [Boudabousia tangfeifanii]|uniref:DoxX family protein n=1 Tax=Boudabousia tangfeifanii TaxID=1912795 RepID=A0A1D9MJX9_9ACTO|nr:DoxX family membrane protein [Boudabousia tangfeifanii]AOZ72480.1 hypothetical protein BK816_03535 [Boudabousia tangfeifanii]